MRQILGAIGLLVLVTGSIARGDDTATKNSTEKAADVAQQVKAKEAQLTALQNELDELRREAGIASQILVKVKIVEIDETLMRKSGFGFRFDTPDGPSAEHGKQLQEITDKLMAPDGGAAASPGSGRMKFMTLPANNAFFAFVDALEKQKLAEVLCEPNVAALCGRAASFQSGGAFPLALGPRAPGNEQGAKEVTMKRYGTSVEFLPVALGNDRVRAELRVELSSIDNTREIGQGDYKIPGLKTLEFCTTFNGRFGETLLCASVSQERDPPVQPGAANGAAAAKTKHLFRQLLLVTIEGLDELNVAEQPQPLVK